MKALLLHSGRFRAYLQKPATRPKGIEPDPRNTKLEWMRDCLTCFFTIESNDTETQLAKLHAEIVKSAEDVGTNRLMIVPFAHLSNDLAPPKIAKAMFLQLVNMFENNDFMVRSSHFGYHKSLELDTKGHPGAVRYREFN